MKKEVETIPFDVVIRFLYWLIAWTFTCVALWPGSVHATDPITDPQIIGIALVTDDAQIEGSKFVLPSINYWDLKNFCNLMINDYTGYRNAMFDYARRHDLTPEDSELAQQVAARGKEAMAELQKLVGLQLEKRYLEYEIELHERTLKTMRDVFLPNVQNFELRKMILDLKPIVQGRLDWALKIKQVYP